MVVHFHNAQPARSAVMAPGRLDLLAMLAVAELVKVIDVMMGFAPTHVVLVSQVHVRACSWQFVAFCVEVCLLAHFYPNLDQWVCLQQLLSKTALTFVLDATHD